MVTTTNNKPSTKYRYLVSILTLKNNSKLEEYLVAFSSIAPPILQDIFVLYYTFKNPDISSIHFRMFQEIKEWGIKQKAIKISIQTIATITV